MMLRPPHLEFIPFPFISSHSSSFHSWLSSHSDLKPLINENRRPFCCCPVSSVSGRALGVGGPGFRPERSLLGCAGGTGLVRPRGLAPPAVPLLPSALSAEARLLPSPPASARACIPMLSAAPSSTPASWQCQRAGLEQVLSGTCSETRGGGLRVACERGAHGQARSL